MMNTPYKHNRLSKAMEGLQELTLELTNTCPLRCLHCSSNSCPSRNDTLDDEVVARLITEAARLGADKVSFGGGEPTLAKCLIPAITQVVNQGMYVEVFTCGVCSDGKQLCSISTQIIERCKRLKGLKFIFSLYGATSGVHDHITQTPTSFRVLMNSLHKCLDAGLDCEINFVPLRSNVRQFSSVVELAEDLGVNKFSALRFVAQGRGYQNQYELELFKEEEDIFVETLLRLRREKNIFIRTGSPFNGIVPGNKVECRAGSGKLVVQASGNVLPCEVFKHHNRCRWGLSVYKQTLAQILESPKLLALRRNLGNSQFFECPVHKVLRAQQRIGLCHEQIPETAVQA
jgi:MoaA/NifB/PqqE/SkfB family radical SAM enzyme